MIGWRDWRGDDWISRCTAVRPFPPCEYRAKGMHLHLYNKIFLIRIMGITKLPVGSYHVASFAHRSLGNSIKPYTVAVL